MRVITFLILLLLNIGPALGQALGFAPCQVQKRSVSVDAECAVLSRPENPANPTGPKVDVHVAKFPARTPEPAADAFTIIQGGPGMSSIDLYLSMQGVFAGIQAKRDILVIDQRGTGRSNMLTCEFEDESDYTTFDPVRTKLLAEECLAKLDADPRFYTTSVAVQDLDAVRQAAGYDQLTLYGVSYGTRVAQHYLRTFPAQTRAVVLDGVADVGLNLAGSEIAIRSQQAFDRMVERCRSNSACQDQFGNLAEKFSELRERLANTPQTVKFAHPESGVFIEETLTDMHLLAMVRLMPYSTESLALLPLILAEAHAGNYIPMAAHSVLIEQQFTKNYAYAMNNSVVCSEDAPFLTEADLQGHESTYFGPLMAESMQAMCSVWPQGPVDQQFRDAFSSDVPALLLSGETDPITPPANGERAAAMFTQAKHIVVPHHGHGVIGRGCLPQFVSEFVEAGSVQGLDESCVERELALPFFISPAGPTP